MKTRCKFRVSSVTEFDSNGGPRHQRVELEARYDPNKTEDQSFAEATPSGSMDFHVTNPAVIDHFRPGQEYYIDLIPVPVPVE